MIWQISQMMVCTKVYIFNLVKAITLCFSTSVVYPYVDALYTQLFLSISECKILLNIRNQPVVKERCAWLFRLSNRAISFLGWKNNPANER